MLFVDANQQGLFQTRQSPELYRPGHIEKIIVEVYRAFEDVDRIAHALLNRCWNSL